MTKRVYLLGLFLLSMGAIFFGSTIGSVDVSLAEFFSILFHHSDDTMLATIIWQVRLPRVLMAYFVGAALAVSGTVMQSLLGNPLASSYTLGVSAGASLGAALIMITGVTVSFIGSLLLPATGFVFGLATVLFILVAVRSLDNQMNNQTVVLIGMIVTLFISAVLTMLTAIYQDYLKQLIFWQMGSFSGSDWETLRLFVLTTLLASFFLWREANALDSLSLGEEQAMMVGVEVKHLKLRVILWSTLLAGSAVSFVGVIGFVDLIAPHILRRLLGATHRWVIPGAALLGGSLMVIADTVSRTLLSPREIPVGAVTALIGAPFFLYLYFKKRSQIQ
ncbi:iron ABC transporter permease [Enterococcus saccharolyticus]|uniref:FecCD family ABC transporter permease n=1 Tax=Enterococcus saccharolyticus TaxID=41997 RepID=UPI001E3DA9B1|nr:iron ABC transporter permease [Enterococcus saccharolyticus]MCD5002942.1 iron ABC transporter permease [Enterococcus saccharolyticus]